MQYPTYRMENARKTQPVASAILTKEYIGLVETILLNHPPKSCWSWLQWCHFTPLHTSHSGLRLMTWKNDTFCNDYTFLMTALHIIWLKSILEAVMCNVICSKQSSSSSMSTCVNHNIYGDGVSLGVTIDFSTWKVCFIGKFHINLVSPIFTTIPMFQSWSLQ